MHNTVCLSTPHTQVHTTESTPQPSLSRSAAWCLVSDSNGSNCLLLGPHNTLVQVTTRYIQEQQQHNPSSSSSSASDNQPAGLKSLSSSSTTPIHTSNQGGGYHAPDVSVKLLSSDLDVMAISVSDPVWVLLSSTYGVMEVDKKSPPHPSAMDAAASTGGR